MRNSVHFSKRQDGIPLGARANCSAGFSLIELLVVTGVLTLVTGLILASHSRFGGLVLLENLAYDVALSIRQAQVYGISVRQFGQGNFALGYGVHLSLSSPYEYILFGDAISQNGIYDACEGGVCELVQSTTISRGYFISQLCAPAGSSIDACSEVDSLDIVFQRPEPDAFIRANGGGSLEESARVVLESPRGDRKSVVVEITGQIATE